jgi:hypothetical protein
MSKSENFINGMVICQKYMTDETVIGVFGLSNISLSELKRISKDDLKNLKSLGWNAGNSDYGWAEFSNLEYIIL